MNITQMQSLALGLLCALLFAVLGGSLIEWSKYIAGYLRGEKTSSLASEPQATVGLIDLLVTALVLVLFFFLAAVSWRALGLPVGTNPQPSEAVSSNRTLPSPSDHDLLDAIYKTSEEAIEQEPDAAAFGGSVGSSLSNDPPPQAPARMSQSQFIYSGFAMSAQLFCVIFMTFFIVARTGCAYKKLGWRTDQIMGDICVGVQCFLMMTPLILVMNALLQSLTQTPYEHPVQEMIKQYPWLLGIAFWQAAIVAPISEEFAFRVLLIGWFESIHFGRDKIYAIMFGTSQDPSLQSVDNSRTPDNTIASTDQANPYSAPQPMEMAGHEEWQSLPNENRNQPWVRYRAPWWPVLMSGTLFGLAHYSYGVSWIALIVFGVVLGRLYQLRQSIIPVILVHLLFNGMNVALLGLSLYLPKPGG